MKKLSLVELKKQLSKPFPEEAYSSYVARDGKTLTAINPQYEILRLNDVFGTGRWKNTLTCETVQNIGLSPDAEPFWEASVKCTLTVEQYGIHHEQFGGHKCSDRGDALKSAATDAFGKCCQMLGMCPDVYLGLRESQNMPQVEQYGNECILSSFKQSGVSKFVYLSGIAVERKECEGGFWMNISGVLSFFSHISIPEAVRSIEFSPGIQICLHGLWESAKKGPRFLRVTNVLQIRKFDSLEIPELKK